MSILPNKSERAVLKIVLAAYLITAMLCLCSCGSACKDVQCTVKATGFKMEFYSVNPYNLATMNRDTNKVICTPIN